MPVFQLSESIDFPPPGLAEPDGLLAVGGDLSTERLLYAYRSGIFPWYGEGDPILWWSPSPRLVLFPHEFHVSRRLSRTIRQQRFSVTADQAFEEVISSCSSIRGNNRQETWITDDMKNAYCRLHELGFAHSVECWLNEKLVGGLYGVCIDKVFFGESMFAIADNASKLSLHALVQYCLEHHFAMIDCQVRTGHLQRLGAREIEREEFHAILQQSSVDLLPQQKWRLKQGQKEG